MDWSHLAAAALGSLAALLVKEFIDWLRAERAHRLELRQRYFDSKLEATIRVVKTVKTLTSTLRHTITMSREIMQGSEPIEPSYLNQIAEMHKENVKRVNDETAGTLALMGFYYDDELQRLVQNANISPTSLLQKITAFTQDVSAVVEARQVLDQDPPAPDDIREIAQHRIAEYDARAHRDICDLADMAASFDATADAIVTRMKRDFDNIRF